MRIIHNKILNDNKHICNDSITMDEGKLNGHSNKPGIKT